MKNLWMSSLLRRAVMKEESCGVYSGASLMKAGLLIPLMKGDYAAAQYEINRV